MKKLIATLMSLMIVSGLTACGNKNSSSDGKSKQEDSAVSNNDSESNDISEIDSDSESDNDEATPEADNSPITVDDVLNHPETPAEDFEYSPGDEYNPQVSIEKYIGTDPIVVIPETIDGYPVTTMSNGGFATESSIVKGVKIPSGIKELSQTFNCNENLQIVLADGVEKIGDGTFNYNSELKYIDMGNNLKEITPSNFFFTVEIHIPNGVTELECTFWSPDTATITGEAGSYAESFAEEKGITFEVK